MGLFGGLFGGCWGLTDEKRAELREIEKVINRTPKDKEEAEEFKKLLRRYKELARDAVGRELKSCRYIIEQAENRWRRYIGNPARTGARI